MAVSIPGFFAFGKFVGTGLSQKWRRAAKLAENGKFQTTKMPAREKDGYNLGIETFAQFYDYSELAESYHRNE